MERKYNYRNEIKWESRKARTERAVRNWNRNLIGVFLSACLFLFVVLTTLNGLRLFGQYGTLLVMFTMMGTLYFGRELAILPKGQIVASGVKAALCLGMAMCYVMLHQGYWDWMDYGILGILIGVVLLDVPKVLRAWKELKKYS